MVRSQPAARQNAVARSETSRPKLTTGTTPVNVLTIYNPAHWSGHINRIEGFPDALSLSNDAGKSVTFTLLENPTEIGGTMALTPVDADHGAIEYDTAGTTVVGGTELGSLTLAGNTSDKFDLSKVGHLLPGNRWTITATLVSGSNDNVSASISYDERV